MIKKHKICSRCGIDKPAKEYSIYYCKKNDTHYLMWCCKECDRQYSRRKYNADPERACKLAREYRENNSDKIRNANKSWYKRNAEKAKQSRKEYYVKNYEELKERRARDYRVNRERYLKNNRRWWKKNGMIYRTRNCAQVEKANCRYRQSEKGKIVRKIIDINRSFKRRIALARAENPVSKNDIKKLYERALNYGRCPLCNRGSKEWAIEHAIPLSRGGTHGAENIYFCCKQCNRGVGGKHTKTLEEFAGISFKNLPVIL
jgi:hypothetical protein